MDIWSIVGNRDVSALTAALDQDSSIVEERSKWGNSLLTLAVDMNDQEMVKIILEHGANPNGKVDKRSPSSGQEFLGLVPLMFSKSVAVIDLLVKNGADVDAKDDQGRSVLFVVSKLFRPELSQRLVELGVTTKTEDISKIFNLVDDEYQFRTKKISHTPSKRIEQLRSMHDWCRSHL